MQEFGGTGDALIAVFGVSLSARYAGSLLVGAVVLLMFAYRQLNSPSYDLDAEQRRLFASLMPADISGGRAFFRAYAFYAITLLATFFLLSIVLPLIPGSGKLFGFEQYGYRFERPDFDEAAVPLLVSLAMIGLGPAIPVLRTIEETFRRMAHRLVGIPDNILDIAQRIGNVELDRAKADNEEIAAFREGERICEGSPISGTQLEWELSDLITRICLARNWLFSFSFANRWPPQSIRNRFSHYFDTLQADIEDALRAVEAAKAESRDYERRFGAKEAGAAAETPEQPSQDVQSVAARYLEAQWADARRRAQNAWVGASTVLALYAVNAENMSNVRSELLRATIAAAHASRQRPILDMVARAVLIAAFAVFAVTMAFAYEGTIATGTSEGSKFAPIWTALTFTVGALSIYAPSTFVAWLHRGSKVRRQRWVKAGLSPSGFPTIQYMGMFVSSYFASFVVLNLFAIFSKYLIATDKTTVITEFFYSDEIYYTAAWALLGGLQGCCLCLWQDVTEAARERIGFLRCVALGLCQAAAFAVVGLIGELIQGKTFAGSLFNIGFTSFIGFLLGYLTVRSLNDYRDRLRANQT